MITTLLTPFNAGVPRARPLDPSPPSLWRPWELAPRRPATCIASLRRPAPCAASAATDSAGHGGQADSTLSGALRPRLRRAGAGLSEGLQGPGGPPPAPPRLRLRRAGGRPCRHADCPGAWRRSGASLSGPRLAGAGSYGGRGVRGKRGAGGSARAPVPAPAPVKERRGGPDRARRREPGGYAPLSKQQASA
jgi:hypothetical protein